MSKPTQVQADVLDRRAAGDRRNAVLGAFALIALGCSSSHGANLGEVATSRSALTAGATGVFATVATGSPDPRADATLAFDATHGVSVLFGGSTSTVIGDTWTWNGAAWSKSCTAAACTKTAPSARRYAGMTFFTERGTVALFGGQIASNGNVCDLLEWNGTSWTSLSSPATCGGSVPSAREGHAMADFGQRGLVVFGGATAAGYVDDLWAWSATDAGSGWSKLCTSTSCAAAPRPTARFASTLVHDTANDTLLLFGGFDANDAPLPDLWQFDGQIWKELCTDGACVATRPSARFAHGAAFDPARGRMFVHGGCSKDCATRLGDSYEWDGTTWSPSAISEVTRSHFSATFDMKRRRIVEFGGLTSTLATLSSDTVEYHARGEPCGAAGTCDTGNCVDGVCCETALCGTCARCNDPASSGVCAPVASADDDTCTGTSTCDANAACKSKDGIAGCKGATDCASGNCVDGHCCDTPCHGVCSACDGTDGICHAVTNGKDPDTCGSSGKTCDPRGACTLEAGQKCNVGAECASQFCSDGVCCNTACSGQCDVCSAEKGASQDGVCTVYPTGTDSQQCNGFLCGGGPTCPSVCHADADCASDHYCGSGTCLAKKQGGERCTALNQCAAGHCTDGVCCESDCKDQCAACNDVGKCVPIQGPPQGTRAACHGEGPCAGSCDGKQTDGCFYPAQGTSCSDATCVYDWRVAAGQCDGAGSCVKPDPTPCGDFTCKGGECALTCSVQADCRRGAVCDTSGGAGACNAETAECQGYFLKLGDGTRVSCEGFSCTGTACRFQCNADTDCAPGYSCVAQACEPVLGADGGIADAGADGSVPKTSVAEKQAEAQKSTGCTVAYRKTTPSGIPWAWLASLGASVAALGRRRQRAGGLRVQ